MSLFRSSPAKRYGPSLLDALRIGVSVYRLDNARDPASLRIVYSNPASGQITGLDVGPLIGRRLVDVLPDVAGTPVLDLYADVARTGTGRDLGEVVYGDDQITQRTFHVEAVPLPYRSVGIVFEDVSDRAENVALRDARARIAREEVRYRTLVEATAAVVWSATPTGAMADEAEAWCAYTGQTPEAAAGLGWLDAVHPDDRARVRSRWTAAVAGRTPFEIDLRLHRADGEARRIHARAVPVPGPDSTVAEYVGVGTDIEEQNAAALALAASEARFRTIFDALADAVLVYPLGPDGPGPFVDFNQVALDTYGYDEAVFRTMSVHDLVPSGTASVVDALDELRRTRQATFETVHRTHDGRLIPMQVSARLVEYEGELCVLAVARNDAERRAFQRELSRANLGLERTVDARTAELQAFADALRTVQSITARPFETPLARTEAYLAAGCTMLGMPVGILSATPLDPATGERLYRLDAVVSPDPSLHTGLVAPISEAFCDAVLERGEMVSYTDAAADPALSCHPAHASRGLRSFIGTPVRIDGETVGTLNFVSPAPRPAGFQPYERDLVEIIADAVSRRLVADRAEAERRRVEEWSRSIVETVGDGIILVDADCRVIFSNPSARVLLGLHEERGENETDVLGDRWPVVGEDGELLAVDDLPEREVIRTGRPVRGRLQGILAPDAPPRWYRVNASPIDHNGDGTLDAVVVSYADITEHRAATEEARQSSALLRAVQEASPEGVMAFRTLRDERGEIVDFAFIHANARSAEIVERPGDDFVGQTLLGEFPGNREAGLFDGYKRVVETGEVFRTQVHYVHAELTASLQIAAAPLDLGGDGSPDGVVVVFMHITPDGGAAGDGVPGAVAAPE
ncbi:MAG TPA: PAS domain S-box protein [Rubricoccaceae bacterium]|jgi:PAS domain S-box-containing protein